MSSNKPRIVLKKHKTLDKIWHPESTLIFKSEQDKLVIGRYHNDTFISLDEKGVELCIKWKFKYDTTLITKKKNINSSEDEQDEEAEDSSELNEEDEIEISPSNKSSSDNINPEKISYDSRTVTETQNIEKSKEKLNTYIKVFTESSELLCNNIKEFVYALEKHHLSYVRLIQNEHDTAMKEKDILLEKTQTQLKMTLEELEETKNKLDNIKKFLDM